MAFELRLQQKMSQQLVMTPQLQQAIKLLQLSHLELADVLRQEMEENPILEEQGNESQPDETPLSDPENDGLMGLDTTPKAVEDNTETSSEGSADSAAESLDNTATSEIANDLTQSVSDNPSENAPEPSAKELDNDIDWEAYLESQSYSLPASAGGTNFDDMPAFDATLSAPGSLIEHMRWQVQMADFNEKELPITMRIIEELNDDGYVPEDICDIVAEDLEVSPEDVEGLLLRLQSFEPLGVAARNLRESLLIQLVETPYNQSLVRDIIDRFLPQIERRNYQAVAKELKVPLAEIGEALKVIAHLEPRPGRSYNEKQAEYIAPDIYVKKVGDEYVILQNDDGLPKLRISNYYRKALEGSGGATKEFIQEKMRAAAWLIRSIHMRQRTIYRVMESILKFQQDFFEKGVEHLKPLVLKDVAEDIEMHESTISRVTTNKYVHTPQGIFELKYFFNSSISSSGGGDDVASESVRNHIKNLVAAENPKKPLSDQKLVQLLAEKDIKVARRTVAKYREMLKIQSSSRRKKVF